MLVAQFIIYLLLFATLYFQVFILITFLGTRKDIFQSKNNEPQKFPSVTIMVPCFNEEKTVEGTVESLLKLNYPEDKLKIMVIDDGSTDSTQEALNKYKNNNQVEIYYKENGGKHTALNYGLDKIDSDLIGCLDADSSVEEDALRIIVNHFLSDKKIDAIIPSIIIREPKSIIQRVQRAEYYGSIFLRKVLSYLGAIYVTPGPFSIFKKEVFETIGQYKNGHNTEDFELALRMQSQKMKIINVHQARVYTDGPYSAQKLHKQRLRWTYGFLRNVMDYKKLFSSKHGALGTVILPNGIIALFTIVLIIALGIFNIFYILFSKIRALSTVDWQMQVPSIVQNPDIFYINTDPLTFIGIIFFLFTILVFTYGKKIAGQPKGLLLDFILFLFIYLIISPLWIIHTFISLILAKKTEWR